MADLTPERVAAWRTVCDVQEVVAIHRDELLVLLDGVDGVLALCARWDAVTKGTSPTTEAIYTALGVTR